MNLHYNGANSYLFVNGTEIIEFKAKDSEIVTNRLCLGRILKDWSVDKMKKTGWNRHAYDFIVDYNATVAADIVDINKYLMKRNDIIKNVWIDQKNICFNNNVF